MTTPAHVRTVALLHTPPSEPAHVDWMWAPSEAPVGDNERVLITLRVDAPPLDMAGPFEALRIADHRGRYLWFEGDIGRGLGSVQRLWQGVATLIAQDDTSFALEIEGTCFEGVAIRAHDEGTRYRVDTRSVG